MSCLSPVSIKVAYNPLTDPQKRHGYHYINVPCGHCLGCLQQRKLEWSFRLENEARYCGYPCLFVTLTYNNDFLPSDGNLHKEDLVRFVRKLRRCSAVHFKYYGCGEYGERFGRPHFHICLFPQDGVIDWSDVNDAWSLQDKYGNKISYGLCNIKPFIPARGAYVAKYSMKQFGLDYSGRTLPFALMSKHLGEKFVSVNKKDFVRNHTLMTQNLSGRRVRLSRYYRDKIFTASEVVDFMNETEQYYSSHYDTGRIIKNKNMLESIEKQAKEKLNQSILNSTQ